MNMFNIYLVMQLDSIKDAIWFVVMCLFMVWVIVGTVGLFAHIDKDDWRVFIPAMIMPFVIALCTLIGALLPSSKTAAAMIIMPKIANSEVVTDKLPKEAEEMYKLAKKALVDLAKDKEAVK